MRLPTQFPFRTAAVLLVVACSDGPVTPDAGDRSFAIFDAVHNDGNAHFFWLPPMVPDPSPTGTFDGTLQPVVEICDLGIVSDPDENTPCLAPQFPFPIQFTLSSGLGSETVRVNDTEEHYIVNWHTDAVNANRAYRINVVVGETELGFADVDVVNRGKELKSVDTGEFIALKDGRTLPIKFRIENGALDPV